MIRDHIETIAANSFSNFHAKGLDYLCLQRSETLTVKAYFYDDAAAAVSPEVVCPHDHRYPFSTTILSGQSEHYRYSAEDDRPGCQLYQRFDWSTPLNGGRGFSWRGQVVLAPWEPERYRRGDTYWCEADEIHTIAIRQPQTVLLLVQHADVVPIGAPTMTFVPGANREPPPLDGLYDRMTVDRARELLAIVGSLTTGNQP